MTATTKETLGFQTEVKQLLHLMIHSLYSNKEIFLRELVSNASDACDRLRYAALTQPDLTQGDGEFKITLSVDKSGKRLTVSDNGIGMNREDMVENLGTIARSGTSAFMSSLSGDAKKDVSLIGQFGVGFYSAFMVADEVEVVSRKAGEEQAWRWVSDGRGTFTVASTTRESRGTSVTLSLKPDAAEFLEASQLRAIVAQYSDHIAIPIVLKGDKGEKDETLNRATALWTRTRSDIKPEQYKEFYHHVAHLGDEPWHTAHWRAEGKIEYTALLFVPGSPPFDLYLPERRHGVKLYVKRVFITEAHEGLVPRCLRFLRGVVDSEDLPLNISREMLQHNPVLALIRNGLVNRVLGDLEKKAKDAPEEYAKFWKNFGPVIKEGIYESPEYRQALIGLSRFRSTTSGDDNALVSLDDYVNRMKPGQDAIYYIAGDDAKLLAGSPQLEGFAKRGLDVLLLSDPVDEFWIPAAGAHQGKPFKSVTRGNIDLSKVPLLDGSKPVDAPAAEGEVSALAALFRLSLQDAVKDVRASSRLTDSAVCLVADDSDLDIHLERLLRLHKQVDHVAKRILEINPAHPLIKALAAEVPKPGSADRLGDIAHLLLDQARLLEGETLPDTAAFARRMTTALTRALGPS